MTEVDSTQPLIRYLIDDPVYYERYRAHLRTFYNTVFTQVMMDGLFDKYHSMIAPYVLGPNGEQPGNTFTNSYAFTSALPVFKAYVAGRRELLKVFLGDP